MLREVDEIEAVGRVVAADTADARVVQKIVQLVVLELDVLAGVMENRLEPVHRAVAVGIVLIAVPCEDQFPIADCAVGLRRDAAVQVEPACLDGVQRRPGALARVAAIVTRVAGIEAGQAVDRYPADAACYVFLAIKRKLERQREGRLVVVADEHVGCGADGAKVGGDLVAALTGVGSNVTCLRVRGDQQRRTGHRGQAQFLNAFHWNTWL
jgi:hypothetical protein